MGKQERWEAQRKLNGKQLWAKSFRLSDLKEIFLYPYRVWKAKKRQEEIRNSLFEADGNSFTLHKKPVVSTPEEDAFFDEIFSKEFKDKHEKEVQENNPEKETE